jgi:site-specific recombinase XerD
MTTGTLLKKFQFYLDRQDLSERTIRGYLDDLHYFQEWTTSIYDQPSSLSQSTFSDLSAFRQSLLTTKRQKPAAINRRIQALKRFFNWAHDKNTIDENPAAKLRFIRRQAPKKPNSLTKTEVHQLLRVAGQSRKNLAKRNYALLQLILQAGLRIGEVEKLQVQDVQISSRSGVIRIVDGKGHKSREVPLNATARRALNTYFKQRKNIFPKQPVFLTQQSTAMSLRSLQAVISEIAKRTKITRLFISAHTLRHTFATNYLKANPGQLVELAALLGHESLNTTAIYTKASITQLAQAVEKSEINIYDSE